LPPQHPHLHVDPIANFNLSQAASAIEGLKMGDSPAKKLNFETVGKENVPFNAEAPILTNVEFKKPIVEEVKTEKAVIVAPTIKPEEADEPLLQENPHRFVLFPIKYHEVRRNNNAVRVKLFNKG
jgi:ribonucleoside-diphosphate reductase subunit M2